MKKILFLLLVVLSISASSQHFTCSDDGALFSWVNGGAPTGGVTVCPAESLYKASTLPHPTFPMKVGDAQISGNGKYLFWGDYKTMFRATYHPDGLTDTVGFDYPGVINMGAFDVNYDGTQVTACYQAPTSPKRCSPGFLTLLNFQLEGNRFVCTDTLSSMDTCHFVHQSYILTSGYIFWTNINEYHLLQSQGSGKYAEIPFLKTPPVRRLGFIVPANGATIFFTGYIDDPDSKQDSIFCLYECRFENEKYSDPVLVRQWKNSPLWQTPINVSPDGLHLLWVNHVKDENNQHPQVDDAMAIHWLGKEWSQPEILFSGFERPTAIRMRNAICVSNTSAVWSAGGAMVYCIALHPGAVVMNLNLQPNAGRGRIALQEIDVYVSDTLIEKEFLFMQLRYVNTTRDTLKMSYYNNYRMEDQARMVPTTSHSWSSIRPDFSELTSENKLIIDVILAPGDTLQFPSLLSFSYSGELLPVSLFARGDSVSGEIIWKIHAGVILNDTRRSEYDPVLDHRGIKREQLTREGSSFILRSWYSNGQPMYETRFDGKCRPEGTWKYFSEKGILLEEKKYGGQESYSVKTWFANGQLKSSGSTNKGCKVGTWEEYYSDGKKKSEGDFRKVWTWHIYLGHLGSEILFGTYAHSYTEWYANGQTKLRIGYNSNGTCEGGVSWYENGAVSAVYMRNKKQCNIHKTLFNIDGTICFDSDLQNAQDQNCSDPMRRLPQLQFEKRSRRRSYYGGYGGKF